MKVKSLLMEALGSLKDQAMLGRAAITGSNLLSDIELAVLRATDRHDEPIDDRYIHEILFLVSNAPGSITFLATKISRRFETTGDPVVSLKTLLLLHRLLRGGDRYFEHDLRNLFSSGELRLDPRWLSANPDPTCYFVLKYSQFLEERMGWFINQAGKLEPATTSSSEFQSYEDKAAESVLHRLLKCQTFLDLIIDCFPVSVMHSSCAGQLAMNIIIRESFRVYDDFCEGIEILVSSFVDLKKPARVSALDILKKACTQTPNLHKFYGNCKRSFSGKCLDYPTVQILTTAHVSSMKQLSLTKYNSSASATTSIDAWLGGRSSKEEDAGQEAEVEMSEALITRFTQRFETKISTVWVEFDDEEDSHDLLTEGGSLTTGRAMEFL